MVSVGAGVDYVNLFNAQLDRQISVDGVNTALTVPTTAGGDATSSLRGQAANWGFHTGVVIQPTEQHSFGIVYHSKVNLRVNGNVTIRNLYGAAASPFGFGGTDFTTSAYTDLVLPQNVQFGYAFKPNEKLMLEADTAWYHWSEGQDLNVRYPAATPTQRALLNTGNPTPFTPRDAWSANVGANYKMTDRWQLRSGFWYEPWAIPESTFSPAFMDLT